MTILSGSHDQTNIYSSLQIFQNNETNQNGSQITFKGSPQKLDSYNPKPLSRQYSASNIQSKKVKKNKKKKEEDRKEGESKIMKIVRARKQNIEDHSVNKIVSTSMISHDQSFLPNTSRVQMSLKRTPKKQNSDEDPTPYYSLQSSGGNSSHTSRSGISKYKLQRSLSNSVVRKTSASVLERLFEDEKKRQENKQKRLALKQEQDQKELSSFPFQPKLRSSSSKSNKRRKFEQFYKEQLDFKNNVENTIQQQRDEEENREYSQGRKARVTPCKGSQEIIAKHLKEKEYVNGDVHERLYHNITLVDNNGQKKKQKSKSLYKNNFQTPTQKRKVTPIQQQRYMDQLVKEAEIRDQKLQQMIIKQKQQEEQRTLVNSPETRQINDQIVLDKLKKDFQNFFQKDMFSPINFQSKHSLKKSFTSKQILEEQNPALNNDLEINSPNYKLGTMIKLKTFIKLMHNLNFIQIKDRRLTEEEQLTDIWRIVGGTNESLIRAEYLFTFLAAILNIQLPEILQEHKKDVRNHTKVGSVLCVDTTTHTAHFTKESDILKIHQKFHQLAINRKQRVREKFQETTELQKHVPQIDKKSKILAEAKFKETGMSRHEYLHKIQKEQMQRKKKMSEERKKLELDQCTFKPELMTQRSKKSRNHSATSNSSSSRSTPKSKKSYKKKKKRYQSQSESQQTEQTPSTNTSLNMTIQRQTRKVIINQANSQLPFNKAMEFQHSHRSSQQNEFEVERSSSQTFGAQYSKNSSLIPESKHIIIQHLIIEKQPPLLYVDVNLGREKGVQRIIIYEGDDAKQIALNFADKNGLSESKRNKLLEMLYIKIKEHKDKHNAAYK